jgi:uncharacterized membrane protein
MNRKILALMVLVAFLMTAGCATYDSAVPASTGIAAGAGALLGYGLTGEATGAAAGAGAGALAGALTGVVLDETRRQTAAPAHGY